MRPQHPESRPPSAAQQKELVGAKRAARLVGLTLPLVLLTAVLVLLLVWMPRLPDPAAIHWSGSGGPDGFGSPWTYVWTLLLAGHGIVLMMWTFVVLGSRMPSPSPRREIPLWSGFQRFLAAFTAGFAALMAITTLASVGVQLDLENATDAGGVGLPVAIGFGAWILVSAIAWFAQPSVTIRRPSGEPSDPLPLAQTERAAWFGEVRPSKAFIGIVGFTVLLMLGSTAMTFATHAPLGIRIMMAVLTPLIVLFCATGAWFRVRIDESGLAARSIVGWPTFRVAASDVERVEVAQVNPLGEFGGWGTRWGPNGFGIVMRTGEGIVATRKDGRVFTVTIDDAERGAAALAAAAERAGGRAGDS